MGRRKKMSKEQRQAYIEKRAANRKLLLSKKLLCRQEKAEARNARQAKRAEQRAARKLYKA